MLELLLIWNLAKKIGQIVEQTGRRSGWFKLLTVVFWVGGELAGAVVGIIVTGTDGAGAYAFAFAGAAVGAGLIYTIANNLSPVQPPTLREQAM